jgi:hypothetical protein
LHDRANAIDLDAVAALRTAALESRLLASRDDLTACSPPRRLRVGDACSEDSHRANQAHSQCVLLHARYSPFRPASS